LKYRGDKSVLAKIITLLDVIRGIEKFDYIVPIPATNKNRIFQPVELIALALGKNRGVQILQNFLVNDGDEELKGIADPVARNELLQKALSLVDENLVAGKRILLVDDLYRSGSTLRIATSLLYRDGNVEAVSVLTMTKTRSNR